MERKESPNWVTDPSGVQHWRREMDKGSTLEDAAAMCLDEVNTFAHGRLRSRPAWFRFNGTPAPIARDDSVGALVERWSVWRNECYDAYGLVEKLRDWRDCLHVEAGL